jgi:hypothetical protein
MHEHFHLGVGAATKKPTPLCRYHVPDRDGGNIEEADTCHMVMALDLNWKVVATHEHSTSVS